MTREDVKGIFPNATDEEITAFLNKHNGEVTAAKSSGVKADELATLRDKAKKYDDYEAEKLTAEQKLKKLTDEAEAAKITNLKMLNKTKAVAEFVNCGLKEDDYKGFIDSIVSDNEETTVNSAKSIAAMLTSQKKAVEDKLKEDGLKNAPKPQGAGGNDGLTSAEKIAEKLATDRATIAKTAAEGLKKYI